MPFNLNKHLFVLATDTALRRELLMRLVPEVHFRLAEQIIPFVPEKDSISDYLKRSVDRTVSWCGDYLPRDYSRKFERMTIVAACSALIHEKQIVIKQGCDVRLQLSRLAGGSHHILTALRVVSLAPDLHSYWERSKQVETEIFVDPMNVLDIENYAASGDIKSLAHDVAWFRPDSGFVRKVVGSDSNVLGLPLCVLGEMFRELAADFDLSRSEV